MLRGFNQVGAVQRAPSAELNIVARDQHRASRAFEVRVDENHVMQMKQRRGFHHRLLRIFTARDYFERVAGRRWRTRGYRLTNQFLDVWIEIRKLCAIVDSTRSISK